MSKSTGKWVGSSGRESVSSATLVLTETTPNGDESFPD
jgi:hypothetical protein